MLSTAALNWLLTRLKAVSLARLAKPLAWAVMALLIAAIRAVLCA